MSVILKFEDQKFVRHMHRILAGRLSLAGDILVDQLQLDLSVPYPENPASLPGEFPRKRTGHLRGSVIATVDSSLPAVTIGPTAEYAEELVESGRLMTQESLDSIRDELVYAILGGGTDGGSVPF